MGVTPESGGKQVYNGPQGQYVRNEYDIGTNNYRTDYSFTPTTTNPVVSGASVEADVNALGNDIKGLTTTSNDANKLIQDRMDALERRRTEEIAQIKAEYASAAEAQGIRQGKDYAGRATGLVTSGGGFLGATQSHEGVLQNLKATFEGEKNALMAKRDAAVREAQNAYDDKQFDLARAKIAEAKDTEKELYSRQKDNADALLAASREKRAQQEFDMGITEKKATAYSIMNDAEFSKVTPAQLAEVDKAYYPGYTVAARTIAQKAEAVKTKKDAVALDSDILDMRLKIPQGQKFTLGGQTYTGLKKAEGGGRETDADFNRNILNYMRGSIFVPNATIIGSDGVPFMETNTETGQPTGKITVEGWKEAQRISGLKREDFINEFKGMLNQDYIGNYDLTPAEIKKHIDGDYIPD